jgi:RHS repeat-associated protein
VLWGLSDHEGTIRDVVNNTGTVVDHRQYGSFGQLTSETDAAVDFLFGYTGQAMDRDTAHPLDANDKGLDYYDARWYDAAVGRFLSEDPAADDVNLYRYCGNNPWNYTDPTGMYQYQGTGAGTSWFPSTCNADVNQIIAGVGSSSQYTPMTQEEINRIQIVPSSTLSMGSIGLGGTANAAGSTSILPGVCSYAGSEPVATVMYAPGATDVPLPPGSATSPTVTQTNNSDWGTQVAEWEHQLARVASGELQRDPSAVPGTSNGLGTTDEAAEHFGNNNNAYSIKIQREMGSSVYQLSNGKYIYTMPVIGKTDAVTPPSTFWNSKWVAVVHTHANYNPNYLNNEFSEGDKYYASFYNVVMYVATPNGTLLKYDPITKKTDVVSKSMPYDSSDPSSPEEEQECLPPYN